MRIPGNEVGLKQNYRKEFRNDLKKYLNIFSYRVYLEKCTVDFDLSIVDRISSLIHQPPICGPARSDPIKWSAKPPSQAVPCFSKSTLKSIQDIKVKCPSFQLNIR